MQTVISGGKIPPHVPPGLVHDFDIYDKLGESGGDPQSGLLLTKEGKRLPDVFWTPANGGHWVVTRSEPYNRVLTEPATFSSWVNVVPESRSFKQSPINLDPPDHTKFRALLNGAFSPKAVAALADQAREMTISLIDGIAPKGHCEFVDEFARQLPIGIFMKMVGLPMADRTMLLDVVDRIVRPTDVTDTTAFYALIAYAQDLLNERRAKPGPDLFSTLTMAQVDGKLLDDQTLIGMFTLLLIGGLDTVASALGFVTNFLARRPDHRRQLIERPDLIPNAAEELFRRFPVSTLVRKVVHDTELGEAPLRAGDLVLMQGAAQTLDEQAFSNPLEVDFSRRIVFHGAFGNGAHRCLGSMLARTEMRIFLDEWLKRIPDFTIDPDRHWKLSSGMVLTVEKLWLRWDV